MRTVIAQWAVLLVVTFWLSSCGGPCCTQATCPTGCTLPCCSAGWNDLLAEDLSNAISPTGSWTDSRCLRGLRSRSGIQGGRENQ